MSAYAADAADLSDVTDVTYSSGDRFMCNFVMESLMLCA
jgi:hypothetical protein